MNDPTMNVTRASFRFFDRLRVRWAEVDMQKIVFNGHYLMYLDTAVAGYWRALAVDYAAAMHSMGGDLYVKKATLEYHASARMDDLLDVGMRCKRIGNSSMLFEGGVFAGEQLLVHGELVYVFADPATQTSKPVPAELRALLEGFEAGEDLLEVKLGNWAELGTWSGALRHEVFVTEQGFHAKDEFDEADNADTTTHCVLMNRLSEPVAVGRLIRDDLGGGWRIGRMATKRVLRAGGLARRVLGVLEAAASRHGADRVALHAQLQAKGFYERCGYRAEGAVFDEEGVAHRRMVKILG
jgi:YbgC/YbaW family acyl-CoA thioester hydrolase